MPEYLNARRDMEKAIGSISELMNGQDKNGEKSREILQRSISREFISMDSLPIIKEIANQEIQAGSERAEVLKRLVEIIQKLENPTVLSEIAESHVDQNLLKNNITVRLRIGRGGDVENMLRQSIRNSYELEATTRFLTSTSFPSDLDTSYVTRALNSLKKVYGDAPKIARNEGGKNNTTNQEQVANKAPVETNHGPALSQNYVQDAKSENKDAKKDGVVPLDNPGTGENINTTTTDAATEKKDVKPAETLTKRQMEIIATGKEFVNILNTEGRSGLEKAVKEKFTNEGQVNVYLREVWRVYEGLPENQVNTLKDVVGTFRAQLHYAEMSADQKKDMSINAGHYKEGSVPEILNDVKRGIVSSEAFFGLLTYASTDNIKEFVQSVKKLPPAARKEIKEKMDEYIRAKSFDIMMAREGFQNNLATFYNAYYNMSPQFGITAEMIQGGQFDIQLTQEGGYYEFMAEAKGKPERYLSKDIDVPLCDDYGTTLSKKVHLAANTELKIMGKAKGNTLLMAFENKGERQYAWVNAEYLRITMQSNAYKWNESIPYDIPFTKGDKLAVKQEYRDSDATKICLYDENGQEIADANEVKNNPMEATGERMGNSIYAQVRLGDKTGYINAWGVEKQK